VLATQEYTIAKELKHINVIKTLDCVCNANHMFLSVELYTGGDLFATLDPSGPGLDVATARQCMLELATGMAYIHEKNIVHSDIKPENVLLHHGVVKICDFGLAGFAGSERTGSSKGTGAYMSPQLVGRKNLQKSYTLEMSQDVWSFGIVLYAVLFADLPWEKARPSDQDFALFCNLGGVSSRIHPFQHVSSSMRKFFRMIFAFNPQKRPTMPQCVEFLNRSTQWYSKSTMQRSSISFGMKENKNYKAAQSDDSIESTDSSLSVSSSTPSLNDTTSIIDDTFTTIERKVREFIL
jgi:calcium-dependent protein kinase